MKKKITEELLETSEQEWTIGYEMDTDGSVSAGTIFIFVLGLWRNISPPEMGLQHLFYKNLISSQNLALAGNSWKATILYGNKILLN